MYIKQRQTGAALVTSLVILTILAIIGFSVLTNSILSEKIANNRQQVETSFFSAQSAINVFVAEGNDDESSLLKMARDVADGSESYASNTVALEGCIDGVTGKYSPDCEATVFNPVGSIKAKVKAQYKGCNSKPIACAGFSMNMGSPSAGCHEYIIEGEGWYANDLTKDAPQPKDVTSQIRQTVTQVALCAEE